MQFPAPAWGSAGLHPGPQLLRQGSPRYPRPPTGASGNSRRRQSGRGPGGWQPPPEARETAGR
eukprot:2577212-Alexandrium_andersonii.AAC.1